MPFLLLFGLTAVTPFTCYFLYRELKRSEDTQEVRFLCFGRYYHRRKDRGFIDFGSLYFLNAFILFGLPFGLIVEWSPYIYHLLH